MDPSVFLTGGQGGLSIAPSSSASSGQVDNRVYFGNSNSGPAVNGAGNLVVGLLLGAGALLLLRALKGKK